jgi:hypothetical protein
MRQKQKHAILAKCPRCEKRHADFGGLGIRKWTGTGVPRIYCDTCRAFVKYGTDCFYIDGFPTGGSLRRKGAAS